ncbi:hypothetical protein [Fischerella thermalis]|nr:hypothetical protein [Fischerella thermalis]
MKNKRRVFLGREMINRQNSNKNKSTKIAPTITQEKYGFLTFS